MPYDLRVIRSQEFVQLDADGHFDLSQSRRLLSDAIWACAKGQIGRVLLDMRDATADLSAAQLGSLADVCRGVSPPGDVHKIGILTRPLQQFDRASWLASVAENQGWNIAAFQEFEEAFAWLIAQAALCPENADHGSAL